MATPISPILDDFNRSNELLSSSGSWSSPFFSNEGGWKLVSNAITPNISSEMLLGISALNSRYFQNSASSVIILVGFHTWYDVQDGGATDPPPSFDWDAYLTALKTTYGCNFTKLWACETTRDWGGDFTGDRMTPTRYVRTGPGNDNDGKLKFDLTQINPDYLNRLRTRAVACANAGIYVCVQLFQGWHIEDKGGTGNPQDYHPYLAANNINSVDGDNDSDGLLTETHMPAAAGNNTLAYQEDMVEAIIDELNDLDNVIWEISNEDTGSANNTTWQEYMINHIKTYEATKPKQHLVGMTKQWPTESDAALDASGADWVSYSATKADAVHAATDPVSMYDTDHTVGITTAYIWIWEAFCNGHGGSWFMDKWYPNMYAEDTRATSADILIRENLGYLVTQVGLLNDLLGMTPQAALCSTGYCLAKDHATAGEYVCFNVNGAATFTLDLTNATGTLNIRWIKCSDGTLDTDDTVAGGAERTLTNPSGFGVSVAYVRYV